MRLYLRTVVFLNSTPDLPRRTLMLLCCGYRIHLPKQTELREPKQTVML
jgi:hypothetical protein